MGWVLASNVRYQVGKAIAASLLSNRAATTAVVLEDDFIKLVAARLKEEPSNLCWRERGAHTASRREDHGNGSVGVGSERKENESAEISQFGNKTTGSWRSIDCCR